MTRWYPRRDAPPRSPPPRRTNRASHVEAPPVRRGIVVLLALGLAGVAGWLWMSGGAREALGESPESHAEITPEDREALREVLREEGTR